MVTKQDDAGSEEACRRSVATSDGDLGVSKHQQRRHQTFLMRRASQRSRRPSGRERPTTCQYYSVNDSVVRRDPYTQQDLPSSTSLSRV